MKIAKILNASIQSIDDLIFDESIQPIKLPRVDAELDGDTMLLVSGWGCTQQGWYSSQRLYAVEVPFVDQKVCVEANFRGEITANMFCAGIMGEGGKDGK